MFNYPEISDTKSIKLESPEFLVLIEFDEIQYRKKHGTKTIKKTVTIPTWLNTAAENAGVNFSQTLQKAIKEQLNI